MSSATAARVAELQAKLAANHAARMEDEEYAAQFTVEQDYLYDEQCNLADVRYYQELEEAW